jgi:hypothetical protein
MSTLFQLDPIAVILLLAINVLLCYLVWTAVR